MDKARITMLAALLALAALTGLPAQAAGAALCQVEATVTLATIENLAAVNGGAGTIAGTQVCEGSIAGAATNFGGAFSFCMHLPTGSHDNRINPATQQPYCSNVAAQPVTEPVHSAVATPAPVVAHINAALSFTLNTGTQCSFSLLGHSDLVLADLNLNGFTCTGGFGSPGGAEIARGQATAAIIVNPLLDCAPGPGGAKLCFNTLAFSGVVEIIDQ